MADLQAAARQAVAERVEIVFVAGGDGTLGTLAGELAHSPVALGVLPAGTANVWAQAAGVPRVSLFDPHALERAALNALNAPTRLIDVGRANGHAFLSWAGMGLDAYVVGRFERERDTARKVGGFGYNTLLTFSVATEWRGMDVRLAARGPAGEAGAVGRYLMVAVCAHNLHGGGFFRFAADWRLDDGLLDLWAFPGEGYGEALGLAARVFASRHARHPGVVRLTGERFDLYTAAPQAIHLDGEPRPATQHLAVEVAPRSLRVLAPRGFARGHTLAGEK
jgi:diacylglycerol kinase family enzyme